MVVSVMSGPEPILVRADDGAELALFRAGHSGTRPQGPGKSTVLLVHGTFSNRGFFGGRNGLAHYLSDQGHDAWVAELRGRRLAGNPSSWEFEDWIVRDAPALIEAVRAASGSERVVWLGHSAGAVVGVGCAARHPELARMLAGLVLISAPLPAKPGRIHTAVARLGHLAGLARGRVPARALGIGPIDESLGLMRQWLGWNAGGHWTGRDDFDYLAAARQVTVPALAIAGGGDVLTTPSACRRLLDALGPGEREMVIAGRAQRFSRNFTHNRVVISPEARDEVWPVLSRWLAGLAP